MKGPALEIERKFLVESDGWRSDDAGTRLQQGYLCTGTTTVRVRVTDERAWLTIKGETTGLTRVEREYPMPVAEARALLDHNSVGSIIDKTRYLVHRGNHQWEVDEFHGDHEGLVLAEVELAAEDEAVELPDWLGPEVSHDPAYRNVTLALGPAEG